MQNEQVGKWTQIIHAYINLLFKRHNMCEVSELIKLVSIHIEKENQLGKFNLAILQHFCLIYSAFFELNKTVDAKNYSTNPEKVHEF